MDKEPMVEPEVMATEVLPEEFLELMEQVAPREAAVAVQMEQVLMEEVAMAVPGVEGEVEANRLWAAMEVNTRAAVAEATMTTVVLVAISEAVVRADLTEAAVPPAAMAERLVAVPGQAKVVPPVRAASAEATEAMKTSEAMAVTA
jgi:hypothetical protein